MTSFARRTFPGSHNRSRREHRQSSGGLAPARCGLIAIAYTAEREGTQKMARQAASTGRLTPIAAPMLDAATEITCEPPDKADFLHAVLCQVGMPRKLSSQQPRAVHLPVSDRRIPDKQALIEEVAAWENGRNKNYAKAEWQFTTADARIKLRRLYRDL